MEWHDHRKSDLAKLLQKKWNGKITTLEANECRGKYELGNQSTNKMIVAMQLVQCNIENTKSKF